MKKLRLKRDWNGLTVRSLRILRTGVAELPAGTLFTVIGNYRGLKLLSHACMTCGIRLRIDRVDEHAVEIIA